MRWLETLIPPPIVALAIGIAVWLAAPSATAALPSLSLRLPLGLAIALTGGGIAAAGSRAFKRARTTVNPLTPEKASALCTQGIQARTPNSNYVRHNIG